MTSYIYIRESEHYDTYNAFKLCYTDDMIPYEYEHCMNEMKRGHITHMYKIDKVKMKTIINIIFYYLIKNGHHCMRGASCEFFYKNAIPMVKSCMDEYNIAYQKLSDNEVQQIYDEITSYMDEKNWAEDAALAELTESECASSSSDYNYFFMKKSFNVFGLGLCFTNSK